MTDWCVHAASSCLQILLIPYCWSVALEKKKDKKEVWQCMAKLQPFVATACAYSSAITVRPRTIVKQSETFGEVSLQAQPEECGVKGQRFIYIYIYFQRQPTNSMVQKIILILHTCTHTCTHRTVCCQNDQS